MLKLSTENKIIIMGVYHFWCLPIMLFECYLSIFMGLANEQEDYFFIPVLTIFFWLPYYLSLLLCKKDYPSGLCIVPLLWLILELLITVLVLIMYSHEPSFRFLGGEPISNLDEAIQFAYRCMEFALGIQTLKIGLTQLKILRWINFRKLPKRPK